MNLFKKIQGMTRKAQQKAKEKEWRKYSRQKRAYDKEQYRKNRARNHIDMFLSWEVEELSEYTNKAAKIALKLHEIHPHLGRKEVFSLGYQQVLKKLSTSTKKLLISECTRSCFPEDQFYHHITAEDHQQFLVKRQGVIRAIIEKLEADIQSDHQRLLEKQKTVDTIRERLDKIREKQDLQEKDLDQKILAIQDQINKVNTVLSLKTPPEPQHFDFDRLEKMLETLQRLKNDPLR
jgi:hypothetical protein